MVSLSTTTTYCSTRGGAKGVSFEDVVLGGLANDRGLYVPEVLPSVSPEELTEVRRKPSSNAVYLALLSSLSFCLSFCVTGLVYRNYRALFSSYFEVRFNNTELPSPPYTY